MVKKQFSFQHKLFFNISIVIVLIISGCTAFISFLLYKNLIQQNTASLDQLTETTGQIIESMVDDMDNLALFLSTNPDIANAFSTLYFTSDATDSQQYLALSATKTLTAVTTPSSSNHFRINLFNQKANFLTTGIPVNFDILNQHLAKNDYITWYQTLPVKNNRSFISSPQKDYLTDSGKRYLSLYREIFNPSYINLPVAIVEIQCPEQLFLDAFNFNSQYCCFVLDEENNLLFSDHSISSPENINDDFITSKKAIDCGWSLVIAQPKTTLYKIVFPVILGTILISLLILLIMMYVIFMVTKHATRPLRDLTKQVENVTIHNLKIDTSNNSLHSNELERLNNAFFHMFERLTNSMDENVKIKSCELRSNLIALQSQMNPHFLYNTLAIIKAMSKEHNTSQINNICDYLSGLLRYTSSNSDSLVSLDAELEQAELYLKLMKIRYEDLFEYEIIISDNVNLEKIQIVRLSIQPILENCFQHGFKKVLPVWNIKIKCWIEEPYWYLSICDNGYGIESDTIISLRKKVAEFLDNPSDSILGLKLGGMGLLNTIVRLKLHFKDTFLFDIKRSADRGTEIILGGLLNDELNDC